MITFLRRNTGTNFEILSFKAIYFFLIVFLTWQCQMIRYLFTNYTFSNDIFNDHGK